MSHFWCIIECLFTLLLRSFISHFFFLMLPLGLSTLRWSFLGLIKLCIILQSLNSSIQGSIFPTTVAHLALQGSLKAPWALTLFFTSCLKLFLSHCGCSEDERVEGVILYFHCSFLHSSFLYVQVCQTKLRMCLESLNWLMSRCA